jgi:two-component sensor histidine kinase
MRDLGNLKAARSKGHWMSHANTPGGDREGRDSPSGVLEWIRKEVTERPSSLGEDLMWGVAAALAGVILRMIFWIPLGDNVPFVTFFPAIVLASLFGGPRGGALCLVIGVAFVWYFFIPPSGQWIRGPLQIGLLAVFAFFGALIVLLMSLFRHALREVSRLRARQEILTDELQHRIKNAMAVVQSIANQTLKSTGGGAAFEAAFSNRLKALSNAHARLGAGRWDAADIRDLVSDALAPFGGSGEGRIEASGPNLLIASEQALSLTLCLHELATNAAKHGALSTPEGRLKIVWSAGPNDGVVRFAWREFDGPSVKKPKRVGFGARLLESAMSQHGGNRAVLSYNPDGVCWTVDFRAH